MKWKKLFPGPIAKNLWHQVQQLYVILSCEKKTWPLREFEARELPSEQML